MDQPQNAAAGTETRTSPAPKKKPGTGGSIADGDPSPSLAFSIEDDTDVLENELEEFYAYVEAPSIIENRVHWEQWAQSKWSSLGMDSNIGAWVSLDSRARRHILQRLLSSLDLEDRDARISASLALLYHLQGSFGETQSEADQVHWIRENTKMVLDLQGLEDIYVAFKRACWRHDWLSGLPDSIPAQSSDHGDTFVMTAQDKAEYLDEINMEVTMHLSQLYMITEMHRGDVDLADTLMTLDPPMPIYLFELVANLREKSIKGFPVKKLVLLLWKALLAVLGGTEDIARCKALVRRREGLAPRSALSRQSVVTPNDVLQFRQEWMAKYPALIDAEDQQELVPGERLASTTQPLPVNGKDASSSHLLPSMLDEERLAAAKAAAAPPLKVGRQKFQTDQSRPYVLPFASGVSRGSAMPLSMQEAISLYQSHMYVDTGLWQMWCVRQELMDDLYGTHDPTAPTLQSELAAMTLSDSTERTPAPQREDMEDEQRLKRIELLYRSTLPSLQSAVIVLLKLMLATTTSSGTSSAFMRATADGALPEQAPSPTLEDVDVVRHREIMNKGISAVLLLCLRWFRVNHMLQFEYLSQILLDSNVLLLILKLFGLHEVGHSIRSRCEAYPFGLFEYCRLVGHSGSQETPQSVLDRTHLRIGDVWPEYPDDPARLRHVPANAPLSQAFSWRNMASAWCLTRILYLVCRHKVHRILLLVQYKSSAILKRTLKVPQPDLELYVLKLLKIQIPYCGRKWRQSNMRIITQIYLRCRPSLRDDWPGGGDVESEVETSLADEQTLRTLIQYYNQTRYHFQPPVLQQQTLSAADDTDGAKHGSGAHAPHQPTAPSHAEADRDAFEREAFPARRTSSVASTPGRYIASVPTDGYLDAYEDMLQELFANVPLESLTAPTPTHPDATSMLPTSSSTAASTSSSSTTDAGQNDWEHLSPREMTYLSRSPRLAPSVPSPTRSPSPAPSARRRSSTVAAPPTSETSASTKTRRHMRNVSFSLLSTSSPALAYHRRVNSSPGMQRPPLHWSMKDLVEDAISSEQGDNVPAPEPDILIPDVPLPSPKPGGIDEVEHIFGA